MQSDHGAYEKPIVHSNWAAACGKHYTQACDIRLIVNRGRLLLEFTGYLVRSSNHTYLIDQSPPPFNQRTLWNNQWNSFTETSNTDKLWYSTYFDTTTSELMFMNVYTVSLSGLGNVR